MRKVQTLWGFLLIFSSLAFSVGLNHSGDPDVERLGLTLVLGLALGVLFQRSRFCMFCMFRDGFRHQNWLPLLGLVACVALGCVGYTVIFGAWVPDPTQGGYLPPNAFIGPVGWHLVVGGLVFGTGMALSGSCISSHLYKAGEGQVSSWVSLVFVIPGFLLGYLSWDFWYLNAIQEAPVIWLPNLLGYSGSLVLQLIILGILALWLLYWSKTAVKNYWRRQGSLKEAFQQILHGRWPPLVGGVAIALIAVVLYLRLRPLGVTSELSRLSLELGRTLELLPARLAGIDQVRGCTPQEATTLLTENAVLVLALIGGSLISSLLRARLRVSPIEWASFPLQAIGGVLLGYGAMINLGCNIGNLVSGIMAHSLSGWVFAVFMVLGIYATMALTQRTALVKGCKVPLVSLHQVPRLPVRDRSPAPSGFTTPEELWDLLRLQPQDVFLLETGRNPDAFEAGHIPYARWVDFQEVFVPVRGFSGLYPDSWHRLACSASLAEKLVVVYDVSSCFRAARLALGLRLAGWKKVLVLNGGLQGWVGLGYPVEKGWGVIDLPFTRQPVASQESRLKIVTAQDILNRAPNTQVWDTRPQQEYNGQLKKSTYSGAIPQSIHVEWSSVFESNKVFVHPNPNLLEQFASLFAREIPKGVYLYCHTGERSSLLAWLLYHLYPEIETIGLYDRSWEEWGNLEELPRTTLALDHLPNHLK